MEYKPFPKTPRLNGDIVITEKLDGTNAAVVITPVLYDELKEHANQRITTVTLGQDETGRPMSYTVRAGSKTRWITPGKDTDNFGFAQWVADRATELVELFHDHSGPSWIRGEWWGRGIQRGYGLEERRFSMFDPFAFEGTDGAGNYAQRIGVYPVPLLYAGPWSPVQIADAEELLRWQGSFAATEFYNPEGICIYHTRSKQTYKVIISGEEGKRADSVRSA